MPFATVNGVKLHYRIDRAARADAPWLVFSNSLGADLQMWAPQIRPLTQHFNVLRYDTRGHGHSEAPAGSYTIDQLAGDVIGLLDHVGIERACFCGISMGSLTGAALAARFPARIVRAVLANTSAKIGSPEVWAPRAQKARAEGWPRSPTRCCRAGSPTRSSNASRACSTRSATPSCIPTRTAMRRTATR
jgi:3-oxoadipate enol-lactonase